MLVGISTPHKKSRLLFERYKKALISAALLCRSSGHPEGVVTYATPAAATATCGPMLRTIPSVPVPGLVPDRGPVGASSVRWRDAARCVSVPSARSPLCGLACGSGERSITSGVASAWSA
jgi:hypothetical protein